MKPRTNLTLRLPDDLKDWIAKQAERNGGSQNSEIVRTLRDAMDRADTSQPSN